MGEKDVDIIQISANYGLLLKDKDRFDIELTQLQAERKELSDNLAQTSKQHDLVNAELGILRGKFAAVQTEKEYIEHSLKGLLFLEEVYILTSFENTFSFYFCR